MSFRRWMRGIGTFRNLTIWKIKEVRCTERSKESQWKAKWDSSQGEKAMWVQGKYIPGPLNIRRNASPPEVQHPHWGLSQHTNHLGRAFLQSFKEADQEANPACDKNLRVKVSFSLPEQLFLHSHSFWKQLMWLDKKSISLIQVSPVNQPLKLASQQQRVS